MNVDMNCMLVCNANYLNGPATTEQCKSNMKSAKWPHFSVKLFFRMGRCRTRCWFHSFLLPGRLSCPAYRREILRELVTHWTSLPRRHTFGSSRNLSFRWGGKIAWRAKRMSMWEANTEQVSRKILSCAEPLGSWNFAGVSCISIGCRHPW